jgi:hypothetical protein
MVATSPYQTAVDLGLTAPTFINTKQTEDLLRVQAYYTYAEMFNNNQVAFSKLLRDDGDDLSRRYVPGSRTIVEATNNYLAKDPSWSWVLSDTGAPAPDPDRLVPQAAVDTLFRREEFAAKFGSLKRWMLIKGDALLHITADPFKPEGTRLRITELEPEQYFPIKDPLDSERVVGCYLVSIIFADDGTTEIAQRLMYRRILTPDDASQFGAPIGTVKVQMGFFAFNKWDDRDPLTEEDLEEVEAPTRLNTEGTALLMQGAVLPAQITAIPVYHFRNKRHGTSTFGVSELQGIETVLGGMTTTMSDEDLAITLQGVGVYATDSGHPVNEQGQEVDWVISPGSVAEVETGKKFWRVEGATNIDASLGHFGALQGIAQQTSGTPEVAVGKVDVQVAQSGIALAIQFAPLTGKNGEKELEIKAKLDQFVHDLLHGWLPAYEGIQSNELLEARVAFAPPIPVNRKEFIEEVAALVKPDVAIISKAFARQLISERLGITFPDDIDTQILDEQTAALDAVGARLDGAVTDGGAAPAE